jgi:hypothetical protein
MNKIESYKAEQEGKLLENEINIKETKKSEKEIQKKLISYVCSQIQSGKFYISRGWSNTINISGDIAYPKELQIPEILSDHEVCNIQTRIKECDSDIELLKMSADNNIVIGSRSNFLKYLKG